MAQATAKMEISIEGLDTATVSVHLVEYIFYKLELRDAKARRRELHNSSKCSKGDCLKRNEEGEYYPKPVLENLCEFCRERHMLHLKIKELASKCRGLMTKIQRHVVRMPYFKHLKKIE
jgi:hypothetical protein